MMKQDDDTTSSLVHLTNTPNTTDGPVMDSCLSSPILSLQRKEVSNLNGSCALRNNKPYICEECKERFHKYKELMVHKETHNTSNHGTSQLCLQKCNNQFDLNPNAHSTDYRFVELYNCKEGANNGSAFTNPREHVSNHVSDEPDHNKCRNDDGSSVGSKAPMSPQRDEYEYQGKCLYKLDSRICTKEKLSCKYKDIEMHKKLHSGVNNCERLYTSPQFSKKSAEYHADSANCKFKEYYSCEICPKYFTTKSDLKRHANIHTAHNLYKCPDCNKYFHRKDNLKRHVSTHACRKQIECSKCDMCFFGTAELKSHVKTAHENDNSYKCKICAKVFTEDADFEYHTKLHRNTIEKHLKCLECNKLFKTNGNLKAHMRTHTGEKPFKCEECSKCFSRQGNLSTHMRCHTGEKPCKCEQCGKSFKHISGLRYHMTTHNNEKPFECKECGKCFKCGSGLKYHMENHPSTVKSHVCEQCGESFSQMNNLKLHTSIHTGQKIHICEICNKHFHRAHELKVHSSVHTNEKPYKCDQCQKCFSRNGSLKVHTRIHMDMKTLKKSSTDLLSMAETNLDGDEKYSL